MKYSADRIIPENQILARCQSGTTLIELMIAVTLMSIIALGFASAFGNVTKAIQFSKSRTLATNLAQEQMQIIKQKTFNKILVTTQTYYNDEFSPQIPYDNGYYPPESITEGGIQFKRYTYVQVVTEDSGELEYFGAIPDSGMKAVLVTVVWGLADKQKVQLRSVVANIDSTISNAVIAGSVTDVGTSSPIDGAVITVAENVGWRDTSDGSGAYTINLSPGSYSMYVNAHGYFPGYAFVSVAANTTAPQDFSLIAMGSGTAMGSVWINDHLVISQVVGSTINAAGFCQEFIELYNPSTFTWTIATNVLSPIVDLRYQRFGSGISTVIDMDYVNLTVAPGQYYLFANTTTVTAAGISRNADAVFKGTNIGYPDLILVAGADSCGGGGGSADGVGIAWSATGNWIDRVGWDQNPGTPRSPPLMESDGIDQHAGFQEGEQYVRKSSTAGVLSGFGRAYDSGNNNKDFVVANPILYFPKNTLDSEPAVAGVPAVGAYVSATDGLSQVVTAYTVGDPPYAQFQLTRIATGTWTIFLASSNFYTEISSVVVVANATTLIPNALTDLPWLAAGYYDSILSSEATQGYVIGTVRDGGGVPITPAVKVTSAGEEAYANETTGSYFLPLLPSIYDITANPDNYNSQYVSQTSQTVVVNLGQVTSGVNFSLAQGGRIRGQVTRDGINPLPGISIIAVDEHIIVRDQEVSGGDGQFLLVNLSTGVYTVEPILGSGETSTPAYSTATVAAGVTVDIGTFTITGTFGIVRGNVSENGSPIRTGVLITCSTSTWTVPPTLSVATLAGSAVYVTNSFEDGTYYLEVRGSTTSTYNLNAYYTKFTGDTPTISPLSLTGITVTAGQTTSDKDFTW